MKKVVAFLMACITSATLVGCKQESDLLPTAPVSFQRISSAKNLAETFSFIYEDGTFPRVSFLLRSDPHMICTFYPDGSQVKRIERYTSDNKLYHVYEYSDTGLLLHEDLPDGYPTAYSLDYGYTADGKPLSVTATIDGYPAKQVESWIYNDQGLLLEHEEQLDVWMEGYFPVYNDPGFPPPCHLRETWAYDQKGQATQYERYKDGALSLQQYCDYDHMGNMVKETVEYHAGEDSLTRVTRYTYSETGLLLEESMEEIKINDAVSLTKQYAYDGQERLISCIHTYGTDEVYEDRRTYDEQGILRSSVTYEVSEQIYITTETFNEMGLPTEKVILDTFKNGEQRHIYRHLYDYDADGNLLQESYHEDEKWVYTTTQEYEENRLIRRISEDRYNPTSILQLHYGEDGTLTDVSTDDVESLMEGADTLITQKTEERTRYWALTYETVEMDEKDVAAYENIHRYIMEQLAER